MLQKQPFQLTDCYDLYILDAKARRVTNSTLKVYSDRVAPFIKWCAGQGIIDADMVTAAHIRAYFIHLQERQLASATINGIGRALRAFFNFLVNDDLIAASPMKRVKIPKVDKKLPMVLSASEVARLLDACRNRRDEALVLFMVDTGVRSFELCGLNVGNVDISTGAVIVHMGKGRKDRNVYIGDRTKRTLARYLVERTSPSSEAPLFVSEKGAERLTDSGLRQALERLGNTAGIKGVSPHTLRRTFAVWSLRSGMTVYHLQALMGHKDLTVLRHYLVLVESDARDAHAQHGPVDNLL